MKFHLDIDISDEDIATAFGEIESRYGQDALRAGIAELYASPYVDDCRESTTSMVVAAETSVCTQKFLREFLKASKAKVMLRFNQEEQTW